MYNQLEMVYVNSAQTVAGKVIHFGRKELDGYGADFSLEAPTAAEILPGRSSCEGYLRG